MKIGVLYFSNAFLLSFLLFYIIKYYFSNYSEVKIERPSHFIFKIIIFAIISNSSYFLQEEILEMNSLISQSMQKIGEIITNKDINFSELISQLNTTISSSETFEIFTTEGLIKSVSSIGLISLLLNYSIRYVLIQVFILSTPFAIFTLINYSTNWIFKQWLKAYFSLLIIQDVVPIVLMLIFSLSNIDKILYIAGIFVLIKINSYVKEIFGGISAEFSGGFQNLANNFIK